MTILIAWFSWKGHTEKVARGLGERLDARLVRIVPAREIRIGREAMKAFLRMRSEIQPATADLAGMDRLVIASPVWAGKVPPFVNTYLDTVANGEGKPFHVIVEMGGRGDAPAIAAVRGILEMKGMRFASSAATVEKDVESGAFGRVLDDFAAQIRNGA